MPRNKEAFNIEKINGELLKIFLERVELKEIPSNVPQKEMLSNFFELGVMPEEYRGFVSLFLFLKERAGERKMEKKEEDVFFELYQLIPTIIESITKTKLPDKLKGKVLSYSVLEDWRMTCSDYIGG
ncbi:MAG: hypothetical protein PHY72_02580 [Candidatus Pacebacteria bacterium]|nr:hypothetical protein [Candidatus Paceibacterota bacterium]